MAAGSQGRKGFTLVEVLTVIAIIGVLAGILIVAVIPMLNKGPDLLDANDILQLQISVNNFKAKHDGTLPPSKIILYPNFNFYKAAIPLEAESLAYINQIWPRLSTKQQPFLNNNSFYWENSPGYKGDNYQWISGVPTPNAGYTLEGDQCLVFFLGGPALTVNGVIGMQGFSSNPQDPCGAGTDRISYFQFHSSRLIDPVINPATKAAGRAKSGFPSYLNNWGQTQQAFVYFSSGKRKNGYNSGGNVSHEILPLDGVAPYYDVFTGPDPKGNYNITSYLNPASFQIVSAGLDGRFTEAGKPYPLSSPKLSPQRCNWNNAVSTDPTLFWKDNRANFTSNQLQVP